MDKHKGLDVRKLSVDLAVAMYKAAGRFPDAEKFGLVSQMRRAAVSIASNIAEGAARQGKKELVQFLSVAAGSASELETQIVMRGKSAWGIRSSWIVYMGILSVSARCCRG